MLRPIYICIYYLFIQIYMYIYIYMPIDITYWGLVGIDWKKAPISSTTPSFFKVSTAWQHNKSNFSQFIAFRCCIFYKPIAVYCKNVLCRCASSCCICSQVRVVIDAEVAFHHRGKLYMTVTTPSESLSSLSPLYKQEASACCL